VSTKLGSLSFVAYNWECENSPVYGVAECPLFRGCLTIEVNVRTCSQDFWNCLLYHEVSTAEGCLLSGFYCSMAF